MEINGNDITCTSAALLVLLYFLTGFHLAQLTEVTNSSLFQNKFGLESRYLGGHDLNGQGTLYWVS